MQTSSPTLEQPYEQDTTTLYILSNFAVGSTSMSSYWHGQIASLRQKSLAVHGYRNNTITIKDEALLTDVLYGSDRALDIWPTWCSFFTQDRSVSESFLLLSIIKAEKGSSYKYELVFRFTYPDHMRVVENIERARKLVVCTPSGLKYEMPFYDAELAKHLRFMRPLWC